MQYSKADYLALLLENPEGLTANEVCELYFDVPDFTTRKALTRLYKQGLARRVKEGVEHRYQITDKGILRYDYFMQLKNGV